MCKRENKVTIEAPRTLGEVWEYGYEIGAFNEGSRGTANVVVRANTEGLVSLAKLLLFVAKEEHKEGYHVHLDGHSGLEPSSNIGLIFHKGLLPRLPTSRHLDA